ncbi:MAG: indolepyruvate oxidoreductase subunit beta, partial [Deltaproteobacteria bacterium]|nr:indolepyruvate oxidoreductase subunit beta [Deltaproteobacteria bacterium]
MNILMAGVGGQGIILASDILAQVMLIYGYDVKKSEIHGMAQRGGSVMSHIRFSDKVFSPIISKAQCDILVSFEEVETARYLDFLKPEARVIVNRYRLSPPSVALGLDEYPDISDLVRTKTRNLFFVDGDDIARSLGNPRVVNAILLGVLSTLLEPDESIWGKC